jgi:preprotein translocase subunit SecA
LKKKKVRHNVLNAKHHENEAYVVAQAGKKAAITVSTNMAGRGTDIMLGGNPEMLARWEYTEKGRNPDDDQEGFAEEVKRFELRCEAERKEILDLGGLHILGTERHESRRIDNQLRGRSGRQGDNGSSRFFLSLEDDLMKMFAGPTTLKLLSKLGMKEGDAIEHPMLTKSVGRAQRKVEERNFLIRKNILEYDEVMDHQRHSFYGMRQGVLEGRNVKELIFSHIDDSVQDAVGTYLDRNYQPNCISEWVRENLSVTIDPERIRGKDREDLNRLISVDAKEEASNMIRVTIGEYMPGDIEFGKGKVLEADETDWDLKGLVDWANASFKADLKVAQIEKLSRAEVTRLLEEKAAKLVDEADLNPLDRYLVPNYGAQELAKWAANKFAGEFKADDFASAEDPNDAADVLMRKARETYARREVVYPVEFALDMTSAALQHNPQQALTQFCAWVKARYELDWNPTALPSAHPAELRTIIIAEAEKWDESRISERAERILTAAGSDPAKLDEWLQQNVGMRLTEAERERAADDPQSVMEEKIASLMRAELTQFERWVLLQILDQAWKDHLYAMDQLKESIGLRSFSQKDPRIEYKREGARLFEEMHQSIRDKVTDLIFKAKLTPQFSPPRQQAPAQPAEAIGTASPGAQSPVSARPQAAPRPVQPAQPAIAAASAAATAAGTATQRRDLEMAERAGATNRDEERTARKKQPMRAVATVGRNEPCPCGSGKKFKQCCGKRS